QGQADRLAGLDSGANLGAVRHLWCPSGWPGGVSDRPATRRGLLVQVRLRYLPSRLLGGRGGGRHVNVTVVFPYKGMTENRKREIRYVYGHMGSMRPGADFVVAVAWSATFTRAVDRNKGLRAAANKNVVVSDADQYPQARTVLVAIEPAYD